MQEEILLKFIYKKAGLFKKSSSAFLYTEIFMVQNPGLNYQSFFCRHTTGKENYYQRKIMDFKISFHKNNF
jgi:hypothetical protein